MDHAEKIAALRQSPDHARVVVGGEEREFCLGRYGLRLAKQKGVDALNADRLPGMDGVAALLYAGCLPFMVEALTPEGEPDPDALPGFDDFADVLTGRELVALAPLVNMRPTPANGHEPAAPAAPFEGGPGHASL